LGRNVQERPKGRQEQEARRRELQTGRRGVVFLRDVE
jgi:hypothetical protein